MTLLTQIFDAIGYWGIALAAIAIAAAAFTGADLYRKYRQKKQTEPTEG